MSDLLEFKDRVVIVTGAGIGLGKGYATFLASRGAKVVVNDLGTSQTGEGTNAKSADIVVEEIKQKGGIAVANYDSVEFGEKIVKQAVDTFGRIDVIINNAGILRDKTFKNMNKDDWDIIVKVHLNGVFSITKAAWPYFLKQKYGRIINITSSSGIYGSYGQANYAMAKSGIIGFTKTLALEGAKANIKSNCIAPIATTRMNEKLLSKEQASLLRAEYITPVVVYLSHESCEDNGTVYELAGSLVCKSRTQMSDGKYFGEGFSPEQFKAHRNEVIDFSNKNVGDESNSIVEKAMKKYKESRNAKF